MKSVTDGHKVAFPLSFATVRLTEKIPNILKKIPLKSNENMKQIYQQLNNFVKFK